MTKDKGKKARKPDIVVVNKNETRCAIIDIAISGDMRELVKKRSKKIEIPGTKERNQKNAEH